VTQVTRPARSASVVIVPPRARRPAR
jgi:hypothetical protein